MKWDMGGAAAVPGAMMASAAAQGEGAVIGRVRIGREYAGWQRTTAG